MASKWHASSFWVLSTWQGPQAAWEVPWGLARLLRVKDAVVDGGGLNNPKGNVPCKCHQNGERSKENQAMWALETDETGLLITPWLLLDLPAQVLPSFRSRSCTSARRLDEAVQDGETEVRWMMISSLSWEKSSVLSFHYTGWLVVGRYDMIFPSWIVIPK